MRENTWTRSALCTNSGCVEVSRVGDRYGVRNSTSPDRTLWFTVREWDAFLAGAKAGEFDAATSYARVHASNA